uniref:Uncharacterized protein n=1 Tax=Coccidioides posadasii RMSCC 3488 TaxID=454284 RepID=A0A0J6IAG6_COCPO|nr:hypothetical protein CPAG_04938 [Coccidioides posadasii RMSCC 3488]
MVGVPQVIVPDEKNTPQFSANNGPDSHGLCLWLGLVGVHDRRPTLRSTNTKIDTTFSWGILYTPMQSYILHMYSTFYPIVYLCPASLARSTLAGPSERQGMYLGSERISYG